jgi:uncharacterized membrane protein
MDPLVLAASVATGASLVFLAYAGVRGQFAIRTDMEAIGLVVVVALSSSVLGTSAFMAGVRMLGASRASIVSSAEPALTAAFAWLAFGDRFGSGQWLGLGLVLASVPILELRSSRAPRQSSEKDRKWTGRSDTDKHPSSASRLASANSTRPHATQAGPAASGSARSSHGGRCASATGSSASGWRTGGETRQRHIEPRRSSEAT